MSSVLIRDLRPHGVTRLLVYCDDINCSHSGTLQIAGMGDDVAIRPLGRHMRCTRCGHLGADVRPDYPASPFAWQGSFQK